MRMSANNQQTRAIPTTVLWARRARTLIAVMTMGYQNSYQLSILNWRFKTHAAAGESAFPYRYPNSRQRRQAKSACSPTVAYTARGTYAAAGDSTAAAAAKEWPGARRGARGPGSRSGCT